jgi:hypothetical protein
MFTPMESTHTSSSSFTSSSRITNDLRKVFDRIISFATPWRRNSAPRGRRVFHGDVEREEFPYGNTHCLSSYYSVFVARLAIMVSSSSIIQNSIHSKKDKTCFCFFFSFFFTSFWNLCVLCKFELEAVKIRLGQKTKKKKQ